MKILSVTSFGILSRGPCKTQKDGISFELFAIEVSV